MFITTFANINRQRTIRPLYANTQATAYAGFLDPSWVKSSANIYPGSVCVKGQGEQFRLYTGAAGEKPFGLSALWVAPNAGIDETATNTTNTFTVWVGDSQAVFEILAPAFDTSADWTPNVDGSRKLLFATKAAHAQGPGLLSPTVAGDVGTDAIAELVEVVSATKIVVRLNRFA